MATKKLKNQIKVFGEMILSTEDFIYDLNNNEAMYLIKQLDKSREDFGFTERLAIYSLREMFTEPDFELEEFLAKVKDKKVKV
jgi:hypothetical protein